MTHTNGRNGHTKPATQPLALPPHSEEAERCLLGSYLIDPDAFYETADMEKSFFYLYKHQLIFEAIEKTNEKSKTIDLMLVGEILRQGGHDDLATYLLDLITAVPTSINASLYADEVIALHQRRVLIRAASRMAQLAYDTTTPLPVDEIKDFIINTGTENESNQYTAKQAVSKFMAQVEENQERPFIGLPSSISGINDHTQVGGYRNKFYIIAARPGMGKTTLLINDTMHMLRQQKRVVFFTLEMESEEIISRLMSIFTGIPYAKIEAGQKSPPNPLSRTVYDAMGFLSESRLIIDDTAGLSPVQMVSRLESIQRKHGRIDCIFLDYAQMMKGKGHNGYEKLSNISNTLRDMPKHFGCPILAAVQLSRGVEDRANKRPQLSDLRGTGSWEEDAYGVFFLYRDEYYNDMSEYPNQVEVITAKMRGGLTGTNYCYFNGATAKIANLRKNTISL